MGAVGSAVRVSRVGVVFAFLTVVVCAFVVFALAGSARADESPSPTASASASAVPSASASESPVPESSPTASTGVEDTEDPPPVGGALTYSLDGDQFAFVQGALVVLVLISIAGVVGSWGRRG